ncbi:unnamed protein product, partial [marine sediment metagenome]
GTIDIEVAYGTDVTDLIATFTTSPDITSIEISSVAQVSGTTPNDFTDPVTYVVTAEDGTTTKNWEVTVTVAPSSAKAITAFDFVALEPTVVGAINETEKTIALTVPFGTAVTALVPTITITGASVAPASGAAQDFTSPVDYTVTAEDASTQVYTVTVTVAPSSAKAITAFDFVALEPTVVGAINETAKTIALTVPFGTAVTALVPTITITGASVAPASGAAQNFTSPVEYTVTAEDASTQVYTVTVTVAPSTAPTVISTSPETDAT